MPKFDFTSSHVFPPLPHAVGRRRGKRSIIGGGGGTAPAQPTARGITHLSQSGDNDTTCKIDTSPFSLIENNCIDIFFQRKKFRSSLIFRFPATEVDPRWPKGGIYLPNRSRGGIEEGSQIFLGAQKKRVDTRAFFRAGSTCIFLLLLL